MKNLIAGLLVLSAIILVACSPMVTSQDKVKHPVADSALIGVWVVEFIGERPVVDRSPARIQFSGDGAIAGNASCNRFFGKYTYTKQALAIDPLGSTRMMCLPALMEQEQRLLEQLPTATTASIENGLLILRDSADQRVIQASREEP